MKGDVHGNDELFDISRAEEVVLAEDRRSLDDIHPSCCSAWHTATPDARTAYEASRYDIEDIRWQTSTQTLIVSKGIIAMGPPVKRYTSHTLHVSASRTLRLAALDQCAVYARSHL